MPKHNKRIEEFNNILGSEQGTDELFSVAGSEQGTDELFSVAGSEQGTGELSNLTTEYTPAKPSDFMKAIRATNSRVINNHSLISIAVGRFVIENIGFDSKEEAYLPVYQSNYLKHLNMVNNILIPGNMKLQYQFDDLVNSKISELQEKGAYIAGMQHRLAWFATEADERNKIMHAETIESIEDIDQEYYSIKRMMTGSLSNAKQLLEEIRGFSSLNDDKRNNLIGILYKRLHKGLYGWKKDRRLPLSKIDKKLQKIKNNEKNSEYMLVFIKSSVKEMYKEFLKNSEDFKKRLDELQIQLIVTNQQNDLRNKLQEELLDVLATDYNNDEIKEKNAEKNIEQQIHVAKILCELDNFRVLSIEQQQEIIKNVSDILNSPSQPQVMADKLPTGFVSTAEASTGFHVSTRSKLTDKVNSILSNSVITGIMQINNDLLVKPEPETTRFRRVMSWLLNAGSDVVNLVFRHNDLKDSFRKIKQEISDLYRNPLGISKRSRLKIMGILLATGVSSVAAAIAVVTLNTTRLFLLTPAEWTRVVSSVVFGPNSAITMLFSNLLPAAITTRALIGVMNYGLTKIHNIKLQQNCDFDVNQQVEKFFGEVKKAKYISNYFVDANDMLNKKLNSDVNANENQNLVEIKLDLMRLWANIRKNPDNKAAISEEWNNIALRLYKLKMMQFGGGSYKNVASKWNEHIVNKLQNNGDIDNNHRIFNETSNCNDVLKQFAVVNLRMLSKVVTGNKELLEKIRNLTTELANNTLRRERANVVKQDPFRVLEDSAQEPAQEAIVQQEQAAVLQQQDDAEENLTNRSDANVMRFSGANLARSSRLLQPRQAITHVLSGFKN